METFFVALYLLLVIFTGFFFALVVCLNVVGIGAIIWHLSGMRRNGKQ